MIIRTWQKTIGKYLAPARRSVPARAAAPMAAASAPRGLVPHRPDLCLATLLLLSVAATSALAQASAPQQSDRQAMANVAVARLDSVWLQPEREAPASVVARNESKLSAETSGVLLRWTHDVGALVKKGELLAQIDPRDSELAAQRARAALAASNARLQLANAQLARARELVGQGFFSQDALAQRETEVALLQSEVSSNKAQLALAQRQLDKTSLRAPFDGSIKQRLAQTGEAVAPGSVLFVISQIGAEEVEATLSPADVAGLRRAADPRLETTNGSFALKLLRVARTLSAPARTQAARLAFKQPAAAPPAGSSGSLRWVERQPHLSPNLLVRRNGVLGIFVKQGSGSEAKARFVPLPAAQEGRASVLPDSLGADALIVVRGQAGLQDGQAINAQPQ